MDEKSQPRKLPMDPGEILRDYLASKTPMKQIKVLAELNACTTRDIVRILEEQGAQIPKQYRREPKSPPPARPERAQPRAAPPRPKILTAGALRRILERVPEDTPVQILGSGVASYVNFLERYDATEDASSYVLELQREEAVT